MTKDEMRKKHEALMEAAAREMEKQGEQVDPSAETRVFRADLGRGTHAMSEGPTTSPKIARHDVPYEQIHNRHPQLESDEVEELLEYCYGKTVYEAAPRFESFSPERLAEVLALSEEEVELYLDDEEEDEVDE